MIEGVFLIDDVFTLKIFYFFSFNFLYFDVLIFIIKF